jgi:hypothetical protein
MRFPAYLFVVRFGRKSIIPSGAMHAHPLLGTEPPASLKTLTPFVAAQELTIIKYAARTLHLRFQYGGAPGKQERAAIARGCREQRCGALQSFTITRCNAMPS